MFVVVVFWFICLFLSSIAFKLTAPDVDDNGVVFRGFLLYIYFFYQWFARDAIVVAVTLQFLMVSKVLFVFSSAKGTLSIMQ